MPLFAATGNFGLSYLLEWVALIFVALFIKRYVAPFLGAQMSAKREQIRGQLAEREEAAAAAAALIAARRAELEAARAEAEGIVRLARDSAASLVEEGRARAAEERERLVRRATAEIEAAHSRVRAEVIAELGSIVVDAAERVVTAELDDANQRRLIAEAISATEAGAPA
ncbi:MAG TPA: F0F1 ATP synthase subunit B [Acidimicrobiales bacterium]|nr:F0F1 ATP synthase subunit B [Acidimicrobiales bacterium]